MSYPGRYYSSSSMNRINGSNVSHTNRYQLDVHEDGEWQVGADMETRTLSIKIKTSGGTVLEFDLLDEDGRILSSNSLSIDDIVELLEKQMAEASS